jgi:probable addiction module antidote protein
MGIEREGFYRALSPRGNPRFSTLVAVAKAMGLKLTFESARRPADSATRYPAQ